MNEQKERAILHKLIEVAKAHTVITYGELRDTQDVGGHCLGLRYYLAKIGHQCKEKGLPLLPALVVNNKTGQPGEGVFIEFYSHFQSSSTDEKQRIIQSEQERVYAQENWSALL